MAGIRPQREKSLDDIELQRVNVFFIVGIASAFKWQNPADTDVVPKCRGILAPDPMRVAILDLVPLPTLPAQ